MTDRDMELNVKDVDGHGASVKKKDDLPSSYVIHVYGK